MAKYDRSIRLDLVNRDKIKKVPSESVIAYIAGDSEDALATIGYVEDAISEALGTVENSLDDIVSGEGV